MKNQKFKLHIAPNHYHSIVVEISHGQTPKVPKPKRGKRKTGVFFVKAILGFYELSYRTGLLVVFMVTKPWHISRREGIKTRVRFQKYVELFSAKQFRSSFVMFVLMIIAATMLFKGAKLVALGLELKGKVLGIATQGTQHLLDAQQMIEEKNVEGAQNQFLAAFQSFKNSKEQFNQTNQLLGTLISLLPQKRDAESLLTAAQLISKSGAQMLEYYKNFNGIKITPQGIESELPLPELFSQGDEALRISLQDITEAHDLVNSINSSSLPKEYSQSLLDVKSKLSILEKSLSNLRDMTAIFQGLAVGKKKVLFVFENNNELRATGGFMGTFGEADLNNGKIEKLKVSSIYDLDGQLQEKIMPPTPLLNVNDRWYMRDSNWFADFRESARKISSFYEKEGGETPDMIIALTPNIIVDLLKLTGPVYMQPYNITLDADNFVEMTQVSTSVEYEKDLNTPKQLLADFVPTLLQKLGEMDESSKEQAIGVIQKNLTSKHMVFFSRDKAVQEKLEVYHWDGGIIDTDRDYLSVVSSNLSGTKSDLFIKQSMKLTSTISSQGTITNHVSITRTNTLPDMEKTSNESFMRVYVPLGSKLLVSSGFDYKNLDTQGSKGYKIDNDIYRWEKSALKDVTTGTFIGNEAGKTYFGNWVTIKGGESQTIDITYELPFKLNKLDHYTLTLQKQIGAMPMDFSFELNFPGRSAEWVNASTDMLETNMLTLKNNLDKDYLYGIVLKQY